MTKKLLYILIWCLTLPSLMAQDSWENVQKTGKGEIKVLYYLKSFPFIYRNQRGKLTGIEHEIMQEFPKFLTKKYGCHVKVTFEELPTFEGVYRQIKEGKQGAFGSASFSITEKRKKEVGFTPAFMPDIDIMICSDNVPNIQDSSQIQEVISKLTGLYVPGSTSELHVRRVKKLVPSIKLKPMNDFDLIRQLVDDEKNLFTFIALDNYILSLKQGRTIRRQNIFRVDNEGHALIYPLNSDWQEPINAYFESQTFQEIIQKSIETHLEPDSRKLYFASSSEERKAHETLLLKMENSLHQLQNKQRELEMSKQSIQRNFLVFIIAFVLIVAAFLIHSIYRKQQTNMLLQEQNDQIMKQKEEIELQRDILNEKQKQITDSIRYAQDIQHAILPFRERIGRSVDEFFILFRPKDIVSGDFYWFSEIESKPIYHTLKSDSGEEQIITSYSPKKVIFVVADCTGHGVPGAFMSMIGTDFLNNIIIEKNITSPNNVLYELHLSIRKALKQDRPSQDRQQNEDGMDIGITVWSPLDDTSFQFEYAGAKRPLFYIENQKLKELKGNRKSVGGRQKEHERTFEKDSFIAQSPFTFYMCSDGFQDQFSAENRRKYGIMRFKKLLETHHALTLKEQYQLIDIELNSWKKDSPQVDDILLAGFRI